MAPRNFILSPPTNPILQVIYFIVGGILVIGAVLMGAVILSFALGLALVAGIVVYIRAWWLQRKLVRTDAASDMRSARSAESQVLEVEYTVVSEDEQRDE